MILIFSYLHSLLRFKRYFYAFSCMNSNYCRHSSSQTDSTFSILSSPRDRRTGSLCTLQTRGTTAFSFSCLNSYKKSNQNKTNNNLNKTNCCTISKTGTYYFVDPFSFLIFLFFLTLYFSLPFEMIFVVYLNDVFTYQFVCYRIS